MLKNKIIPILILICVAILLFTNIMKEAFKPRLGAKCPQCGDLNEKQCLECPQCGVCTPPPGHINIDPYCTPSKPDRSGPLFLAPNECKEWSYE